MTRHDGEDERTDPGRRAPTYEQAPATIEMQPSPFHSAGSRKATEPGMPSPFASSRKATMPGMPAPASPQREPDLAGPTDPDGHPLTWDGANQPWLDGDPTDVMVQRPRVRPEVPSPDAPKIEVSQSLMLESIDVRAAVEAAKAKTRTKTLAARRGARKPRRQHIPQEGPGPAAQTYQMLPALSRKKDKESSDWPLILGLLLLGLIIAALIGVGAYLLVRANVDPTPAVTLPLG